MRSARNFLILALLLVAAAATARAQDPQGAPQAAPQAASQAPPEEERPTGLPGMIDWDFHFDAGWGAFGFGNSYYTDPKEGVAQDYGERWMEGFLKPSLSGVYRLKSTSEFYGKLSAVGERTYADPPALVGLVESSFLPEDLSFGWRSGKAFENLGENALDFVAGRTQYTLGHGFLIWDGAAEGGSRGGYWSNARKAWEFAAVARFKPGAHTVESFYLNKDELPESESKARLWGGNYEYRIGDANTFGVTFMKVWADPLVSPQRNQMNVFNVRAYTAPIPAVSNLSFEFEYAAERNHDLMHADAWTAQGAYQLSDVAWTPKFTYRFASFQGDDVGTARNESFDPLFLGFYDWGYWWQGEIGGEYFLSNSNLQSHMVRGHVAPTDSLGIGAFVYKFLLDEPASYAPGITDRNIAVEADAYVDWKINRNFTASFVAAFADPQRAVQQASGRTKNFRYGMVFLAYSY